MSYPVLFIYPATQPYSGQTAASQLALRELKARGWECTGLGLPGMDRSGPKFFNLLRYGVRVLGDWVRIARAVLGWQRTICFNHSQSYASFLRLGLPHLIIRQLLPGRRIVTSLHGNVFATWAPDSRIMRVFLSILAASDAITVLGETQRAKLVKLGVDSDKLVVLPNTGDMELMPRGAVEDKQNAPRDNPDAPLVLLHLSLLIESKGFIEYLEACENLARSGIGRPLEFILCGPIVYTPYCTWLTTRQKKAAWIKEKIAALNALPGATAVWLPGVVGEDKARLFERAHIFVFPSRYPVEAQPLVLLEAMAAGCCIVTSDQGEIPSTVGTGCGVCIEDVSPPYLTSTIDLLCQDHETRSATALNGRARVEREFSKEAYGQRWDTLLGDVSTTAPTK